MKADAEQNVAKLRDEKARLNKEFEEMKYSGEAKTSTYDRSDIFCRIRNNIYSFLLNCVEVNVFLLKLKTI